LLDVRTGGVAALVLLALAGDAASEVVTLRDGDRITGRILSETPRTVRVETPYGRLAIPRKKVAKILRANGTEEVLNPPEDRTPAPPPAAPEQKARLVLVLTGKTFWQAWDPKDKDTPADPTLRLEVRLDEDVVATYADSRLDPQDIPKAIANSFSFAPEDVRVQAAPRVEVAPPEVRPGRIVLKVDVAGGAGENRRLRVAYQANTGTAEQPAWRDLAESQLALVLRTDVPTFVQLRQDRGTMEFSGFPRRRMKGVETFHLELAAE
jgi:hypothetical protein